MEAFCGARLPTADARVPYPLSPRRSCAGARGHHAEAGSIEAKTHVAGIEPDVTVRVLDVEKAGPDAVNVSYKLRGGQLLQKTVFRADEPKLSVATTSSQFSFHASPEDFKLAAEATRIKLAHLFV